MLFHKAFQIFFILLFCISCATVTPEDEKTRKTEIENLNKAYIETISIHTHKAEATCKYLFDNKNISNNKGYLECVQNMQGTFVQEKQASQMGSIALALSGISFIMLLSMFFSIGQ